MRIVSLLASATEIVCELGLEEQLVGISHECDHPPRVLDRPRVSRTRFDPAEMSSEEVDRAVRRAMQEHGSVYTLDVGRMRGLAPDLVLTQAVCEVCAVPTLGVRQALEEAGVDARVVSLDAHTVDEILETVREVGRAADAAHRADPLVEGWTDRLERVEEAVAGAGRPRVLGIEWLHPPFVPGHWVPEMVERAGGENLAGETGRPSREVGWDDLAGRDPDALLVMPCGYDLEAARADADAHADRLRSVAPRAVQSGDAWVVDASAHFNRSGPRVVRGVEILGGLLHPDRLPRPDPREAGVWMPQPVARS